tara:strand:+ start:265 stop:1401 length:1137 start_codon:yes stop_codon:yes gene_type:complete
VEEYFKNQLKRFVQQEQKVLNFIEEEFFDWFGFINMHTIENEYLSPEFLTKLGYTQNQKEDKTILWKDLIIPEDLDAIKAIVKNVPENGRFDLVVRYLQKNGLILSTRFKGVIFEDTTDDSTRVLGVHEVIYKNVIYNIEKEQNKKLNNINLALAQNNKDLKQFSYLASHDLQQPVNNIISYLSILEDNSSQLNDLGKLSVDMITKHSYKIKNLITSLLEYSIIGTNVAKNKIDIEEVLSSVKDILSAEIVEKNAVIEVYSSNNIIVGYRNDVQLLFLNLIENALKFSKEGSFPEIKIDCEIQDNYFLYSIADNGIGINETYFDKIFDIFYQIQSDETPDGVGIGLAQCKKIVEFYGGEIWVESEENKGATFYFTLPK